MKIAAGAFLYFTLLFAAYMGAHSCEREARAIALEQTCRSLVEAKLVGSCGLK